SDIQLSKFAPSHPRDGFVLMSFYAIAASTLWIQTCHCRNNFSTVMQRLFSYPAVQKRPMNEKALINLVL
ncbi:MAG: hypothetical protein SPL54_01160, partial [Lachnospiraceae bacterium]|nr:hypothetical protein [Lachnospiraceae bacterium]